MGDLRALRRLIQFERRCDICRRSECGLQRKRIVEREHRPETLGEMCRVGRIADEYDVPVPKFGA